MEPSSQAAAAAAEEVVPTAYELMGGHATFQRLVSRFYEGVAVDPILRPLYPEEDLGPAEDRFRMFLEQYWGGPTTYSDQRGHPRLRMRHAPFQIGIRERDAWLARMRVAVDELELGPELTATLWDYFEHAATFMDNTLEDGNNMTVSAPPA
jgi:hemoglobin